MSLNRAEEAVHGYINSHPEELGYWRDKVTAWAAANGDIHVVAGTVAAALVEYCRERAAVRPEFRALGELNSLMLRNLAELLVRRWVAPKPRKTPPIERP